MAKQNKTIPTTLATSSTLSTLTTLPTQHNNKDKTTNRVFDLLSQEKPIFNQMKCGVINGDFYFGTNIYVEGKQLDAIVTSSGRFIYGKQNLKDFGLNYRFSFDQQILDGHISNRAIKSFIQDKPNISIKSVVELVFNINKKYMYYPSDVSHKIIACDIVASYFLTFFEAFGRTIFICEKGSGKTRQSTVYSILAFNALMSNDITKSAFFRVMESTVGTLIVDDFDDIGDDQKRDILQHFKTGYKKASKAIRTGESKNRQIECFSNYGHVVMNNTLGLDDVSIDRTKELELVKSNKSEYTNREFKPNETKWQEARDQLFLNALNNWKTVDKISQTISSTKLSGRKFEVSKSVLTIAKLVDESWYNELEDYFVKMFEAREATVSDGDWGFELCKEFFNQPTGTKIHAKDLSTTLLALEGIDVFHKDYKKRLMPLGRYVNKFFGNLKALFRHGRDGKGTWIELKHKQQYYDWLHTKGWVVLFEKSGLDETSVDSVDAVDKTARDITKNNNGGFNDNKRKVKDFLQNKTPTSIFFICEQLELNLDVIEPILENLCNSGEVLHNPRTYYSLVGGSQ